MPLKMFPQIASRWVFTQFLFSRAILGVGSSNCTRSEEGFCCCILIYRWGNHLGTPQKESLRYPPQMIQLVSKTAMLHRLLLLLSLHLLRCSGATSQEDQTTWKGGANQHNVRKKARKVERSRVLFPQCQIWIVSANKRG